MSTTTFTTRRNTAPATHRRVVRTAATLLAGAVAASGVAMIPTAGTTHAWSGVDSVTLTPVADECEAGQALPCTAGAGTGEANVLYVHQTPYLDGPAWGYSDVQGTSDLDGRMWLAADVSAACKAGHHLIHAHIDGDVDSPAGESKGDLNVWGLGGAADAWPLGLAVPSDRTFGPQRVALNIPIETALAEGNVSYFDSMNEIVQAGEAHIDDLVAGGMTEEEARAEDGYWIDTTVRVAVEAQCEYNGLLYVAYKKRVHVNLPLRIHYLPVPITSEVVVPPAKDRQTTDDLTVRAEVTDVELAIVPDPDDPCTLHLSATIETNRATSVEYRFVNPHGQPSNTYTVDVDDTRIAFVDASVQVPMAENVEIGDDLAVVDGPADLGDYSTGETADDDMWTGTFMIEVVSPNHESDGQGFEVPFCTTPIAGGELDPTRTEFGGTLRGEESDTGELGVQMGVMILL